MKDTDDRTGGLHQSKILYKLISVAFRSYMSSKMELTTKANSRASMKRQICPPNVCELRAFPSLRAKFHGILAINIFTSMHVVDRKSNAHSTANKNWRVSL